MNSFDKDFFREQLATIRKEHNFTQSELSAKLGISDKTYSRWETGDGEPDMASLSMLSEIYGISPSVFFGRPTENTVIDTQLDGLAPSEMIQKAFELQFQVIRGLAKRAFDQKWWKAPQPDIQPPPNRVKTTDHAITAYADNQVYSMMYNGSDANIALSLLPNADKYAWLTSHCEDLSQYLTLLGEPDMVQCLPWLMSDECRDYFTVDYLAKNTGISTEKAAQLMERAAKQNIVGNTITHIGQKETALYRFEADHMLTAIMTLAYLSLSDRANNGHFYFSTPAHLDIQREEVK
ncbi:MAG: helix-turn-helix transcriptional regulator [Ruminococcaceae bacterium]|nr:helix-turn-helix transcriptional regulator [Oscillospiraceae bacterium]